MDAMIPHEGGDNSRSNLILDVIPVNHNLLCILMKSGITNDKDSGLIITIHVH